MFLGDHMCLHMVTCGNMRLHVVTYSDMWLHVAKTPTSERAQYIPGMHQEGQKSQVESDVHQ